MNLRRLGKRMSVALRHDPEEFGLVLDDEGWVAVSDLVAGLNAHWPGEPVTADDIAAAVAASDKERHQLRDGRIRALYGHSTEKRIVKEPAEPPAVLYHGTSELAVPSILTEGLKPMGRQYVHLSRDPEMAAQVGSRHEGPLVILTVDAAAAAADGILFYRGNDRVWLCDELPARYLRLP